jgi:fatty acid desaturase
MATTTASAKHLVLSPLQRKIELMRPWFLLACYVVLAMTGLWWLAIPAAVGTMLAGFVQMHDAIHQSLGVSRKANKLILSCSALLLLKSGHALKVTHLRHHGQCLSDNDPEGAPARWTLKQVFLNGPYHILTLRLASLKISPNTRRIQLIETAITISLLLGFIALYFATGSLVGLVYWGVAFVLSSLMPLWASYIPHKMAGRHPARLRSVKLARLWTPVVSSFAFHHLHHTYPTVPTALLPEASRQLPELEEDDHHH